MLRREKYQRKHWGTLLKLLAGVRQQERARMGRLACARLQCRDVLSVLLLAIFTVVPRAAGQTASELSNKSLEELLDIKVYSASRYYQSTSEAPSSVTVITADEIRKHGYRTLADILRSVRSFYVTYDRNYSYLGVRGFGRPGDLNTRVLLMIDGHRVNDNIYDLALLGTEFPLDVDLIERVEIIRGPSSSLYGSDAFFAVINVITRKSHDVGGLEISFEPGSFSTFKERATYAGEFKGLEFLLSATLYDSAGQTLFFPVYNSPETNNGITRNTDYDRYHDLLFTTSYHGFTLQGVQSSRKKGNPTGEYATVFNDPRTYGIDQHQWLDLSYKGLLPHGWELAARSYYDRYAYDGSWPYPASNLNVDYARGQMWGGEIQLNRTWLKKHHLTFGSEVRDNLQQDQKNYDTDPPFVYLDDRRGSWMWAGYVQDEYAITRRLTLHAGLRHDRYERYGGSTNPRLGPIFRPFEKTALKLLYGTAFRAPNVYEAYYGSGSGGNIMFKTNPGLKPETMRNIEAVWEQAWAARFRSSVAIFRNYVDSIISLQQDASDGLYVFRNADKTRSTGAEIELGKSFAYGLDGRLSYTFNETEDQKTNQVLVNSPRHLAKINLSSPLIRERLFAGLDAQYESSRHTLAGNTAGGFPVFNITLLGHPFKERLDLSVSVYNVFDRKYADPVSNEYLQDVIAQDGRCFRLKLTWKLGE